MTIVYFKDNMKKGEIAEETLPTQKWNINKINCNNF